MFLKKTTTSHFVLGPIKYIRYKIAWADINLENIQNQVPSMK